MTTTPRRLGPGTRFLITAAAAVAGAAAGAAAGEAAGQDAAGPCSDAARAPVGAQLHTPASLECALEFGPQLTSGRALTPSQAASIAAQLSEAYINEDPRLVYSSDPGSHGSAYVYDGGSAYEIDVDDSEYVHRTVDAALAAGDVSVQREYRFTAEQLKAHATSAVSAQTGPDRVVGGLLGGLVAAAVAGIATAGTKTEE